MLRLALVVSLVACGSDAPLKIEAKGVVLPNGKARIDVVTAAGAKVSTGVNPDDAVKADSKGLATIEIPADRIREHDVNVSAELGERYGSTEVVFAPLLPSSALALSGEPTQLGVPQDGTQAAPPPPPGGGIEAALGRVRCPVLTMSISSDALYPPYQQHLIRDVLQWLGADADDVCIESPHGHDAFLIEVEQVGSALTRFLERVEDERG